MTTIFEAINVFIVLFIAGTMMFANTVPATFKKLCYLAVALILLPITGVAIAGSMGFEIFWVSDLIFMHGGGIGIPVVLGYGLALGLLLNKLKRLISGGKSENEHRAEE